MQIKIMISSEIRHLFIQKDKYLRITDLSNSEDNRILVHPRPPSYVPRVAGVSHIPVL